MKQNKPDGREAYITPSIEVIKMENEGVIATSGEPYHPITRSYSHLYPLLQFGIQQRLGRPNQ